MEIIFCIRNLPFGLRSNTATIDEIIACGVNSPNAWAYLWVLPGKYDGTKPAFKPDGGSPWGPDYFSPGEA